MSRKEPLRADLHGATWPPESMPYGRRDPNITPALGLVPTFSATRGTWAPGTTWATKSSLTPRSWVHSR